MRTLLLASLFIGFGSFAQITKKAMFLGNSYTFYNDMPGIVESLATADGNNLVKNQNTQGGYTLELHSTNSLSLDMMNWDTWDYVILQDQSQLPSFPWNQVITDVLPYAELLCDSIRSANECAVPMFFNTWGRENGDSQWDSINTFDKMNERLINAYGYMADQNSGKRAPVGVGFNHIHDDIAPVVTHSGLYAGDGSHPSPQGSYLTACIFYEMIFETSVVGNTHVLSGVSATEATYLQNVAHHVVNDVDSVQLDYTQPLADFTFAINGLDVTYTNESEHAFTYSWDFGDGNNSTDVDPSNTYSTGGTFDVTLTAEYCGNTHDTTFQVVLSAASIDNYESSYELYPNPSTGQFSIEFNGQPQEVLIYSTDGQLLHTIDKGEPLPMIIRSGIYLVKVGIKVERLVVY